MRRIGGPFSRAEMRRLESLLSYAPTDPPAADALEVTIFGPSFGESLAIHIGEGRWIVVDACQHRRLTLPLAYLHRLGVDVGEAVDRIVVSHWDKDHVAGLAQLLTECRSAKLVIASVLNIPEVVSMAYAAAEELKPRHVFGPRRPAVMEYAEAIAIVDQRLSDGADALISAGARTRVYPDSGDVVKDVFVEAWSPSGATGREADQRIAGLCAALASEGRSIPTAVNKNSLSIVLFVRAGERRLLLGADLEHEGSATRGWTNVAVVGGDNLDRGTDVLKIPHHGSVTSEDDSLWQLCGSPGMGLLAPWSRGGKYLPQEEDIERIAAQVDVLYQTAPPVEVDDNEAGSRANLDELGSVTLRCSKYGPLIWEEYPAPRASRIRRLSSSER